MKKWILALVLVFAIVLCVVPDADAAAAKPKFTAQSLLLHKSITINFKVPVDDIKNNFGKVEFYDGSDNFRLMGSYNVLPEDDTIETSANGTKMYVFPYTKLSPDQMDHVIYVRLYDKNWNYTEVKTSVLSYCTKVLKLADSDSYPASLKALMVDLLNYGSAYQEYRNTNTANLVNANLSATDAARATNFVSVDINEGYQQETLAGASVSFYGASLTLENSIFMNFYINAESIEGLTAKVEYTGMVNGETKVNTYDLTDFKEVAAGRYKIVFNKADPSQMSVPVKIWIEKNGAPVSNTLHYSIEDYIASVLKNRANDPSSATYTPELEAVVKTLGNYGATAYSWWKETTEVLTRADLEKAISEVAWTYYMLGNKYQYDSSGITTLGAQQNNLPLSGNAGGKTRLTQDPSPEDASSHQAVYTVCSGYCYDVYYEALSYPILGNKMNCNTMLLWRTTYNDAKQEDMAVLRWHGQDLENTTAIEQYNYYDPVYNLKYMDGVWHTAEETIKFFQDYKTTMRPGDIIVFDNPGHALLYVGNGIILDANGGKYQMENKEILTDSWEHNGTVDYASFEERFLTAIYENFYINDRVAVKKNSICVLRPLDLLTKADGDNDPSNDLLDKSAKLFTNILEVELGFSADSEVSPQDYAYKHKTSKYTVDETTDTRIKYPTMNIDRTVNITPFGTAAQGEKLTYTVAITNNSNNKKYAAYQGTDYTAEEYWRVSVREVIPEGTELIENTVTCPNGYYILNDGTIRWTLDVQPGETVKLSYSVRVTGNIGDEIVSGGGYVANIPTNTITNTIGGAKLEKATTDRMESFFFEGRQVWNSEKYGISAALNDTDFAEEIYKQAAGLKLELPNIQELWDIFFERKKVSVTAGFYIYNNPWVDTTKVINETTGETNTFKTGLHDDHPVVRYLYTLKDAPTGADDKTVYGMLVSDFYGGAFIWSDEFSGDVRVNELRDEYLEDGDIVVCMNLDPITATTNMYDSDGNATPIPDYSSDQVRKVTDNWMVLVRLSSNRYASLTSDGVMENITDAAGLQKAFGYDGFVCLRPSQAYTNVNTALSKHDGTTATLTDADKATNTNLSISDRLLSQEIAAKISNLDMKSVHWIYPNTRFARDVYDEIGIDIDIATAPDGTVATFASYMGNCFTNSTSTNYTIKHQKAMYNYSYTLKDSNTAAGDYSEHYDMIVYCGGNAFPWKNEIQLRNMGELLVGDVLLLGSRKNSFYFCGVYQGDGNFLVAVQDRRFYTVSGYYSMHFEDNEAFNDWFVGSLNDIAESVDEKDAFDPEAYAEIPVENYIVLRPSMAFSNINDHHYRNIIEYLLIPREEVDLSNITINDWTKNGKKTNLDYLAPWLYREAYIDVSEYINIPVIDMKNVIFKTADGALTLRTPADAYYNIYSRIMQEENAYGGLDFIDNDGTNYSCDITNDEVYQWKIGDLFCAGKTGDASTPNRYCVALYQGTNGEGAGYEGKEFLVIYNGGTEGTTCSYMTEAELLSSGYMDYWNYYYVLRPQNLADIRDMDLGELTAREEFALQQISEISTEKDDHGNPIHTSGLKTLLPWMYWQARINVGEEYSVGDGVEDYLYATTAEVRDLLFTLDAESGKYVHNALINQDVPGNEYYMKIRVDGCWGGKGMAADNTIVSFEDKLQIGDLLCAEYNGYEYTCLYQDGSFLVVCSDGTTQVMTAAELDAIDFDYYYTIRPELHAKYGRMIDNGFLTDEEMDVLSDLDLYNTISSRTTLNDVFQLTYYKASIDTTDYPLGSVNDVMLQIFDSVGNIKVLGTVSYNDTYAYQKRMLVESFYGGNDFRTSSTITDDKLKIGDILCLEFAVDTTIGSITYPAGTRYIALYQGAEKGFTAVKEGDEAQTEDNFVTFTTAELETARVGGAFEYFYVLRPEQLTDREMSTNRLTVFEKGAIGDLTIDEFLNDCDSITLKRALAWAYKEAGIDITASDGFVEITVNDVRKLIDPVVADPSAPGYDFYNEMVVPGSYLIGPNGSLITGVGVAKDALQVGDIFCSYHSQALPTDNGMTYDGPNAFLYHVAVYLGGGKFWVSYDKYDDTQVDGRRPAYKVLTYEELAAAENTVAGNLGYRYRYVLRPERLATRDLTDGPLTETELAKIANLTLHDWNSRCFTVGLEGVLPWVYKQALIDITTAEGYTAKTPNDVYKLITNSTAGEFYDKLLVAGSDVDAGSGTKVVQGVGVALENLQIGDIFVARQVYNPAPSESIYTVAVYQGGGNFLTLYWDYTNFATLDKFEQGFAMKTYDELALGDFQPGARVDSTGNTGYRWTYVLRPSQIITRKLSERDLSETEQLHMASLTPADWEAAGGNVNLNGMLRLAYQNLGIDVTEYIALSGDTVFSIMNARDKIFATDGTYSLQPTQTDACAGNWERILLLEDAFGGLGFTPGTGINTFMPTDFEIGDIFCGVKGTTQFGLPAALYWTALYQGNGQFLVIQNGGGEDNQAFVDSTEIFRSDIGTQWSYYYVLRPSQFKLRKLASKPLSAEEINLMSALTVADWEADGSRVNLNGMLQFAYQGLNIDVKDYFILSGDGVDTAMSVRNKIFGSSGNAAPTGTDNYTKMLVAGYYGGVNFNGTTVTCKTTFSQSDFQVGDIFCGIKGPAITGKTNIEYTIALYLGAGRFLMVVSGNGTEASIGRPIKFDSTIGNWTNYYVLRPSQIAGN